MQQISTHDITLFGNGLFRNCSSPVIKINHDWILCVLLSFSFVTNFTAPYGSYIVAVDGVRDTYFTDKTYWEFFVNHQPFGKGMDI